MCNSRETAMKIKITDVHSEDAFINLKGTLNNIVFEVDKGNIKPSVIQDGWYAIEEAFCSLSAFPYFFAGARYKIVK
jgi:hypothetical protein